MLEQRIAFQKLIHSKRQLGYFHEAVRSFGGDLEECLAFNFVFYAGGTYKCQWTRTFDIYSADNERQTGRWVVEQDKLRCETLKGDDEEVGTAGCLMVMYAQPGRIFRLPLCDVIKGRTSDDTKAFSWELAARGKDATGRPEPEALPLGEERTRVVEERGAAPLQAPSVSPNARFVEVDGDMVEVSGDIVEIYPEEKWAQLMRCRLRFGLMGHS